MAYNLFQNQDQGFMTHELNLLLLYYHQDKVLHKNTTEKCQITHPHQSKFFGTIAITKKNLTVS